MNSCAPPGFQVRAASRCATALSAYVPLAADPGSPRDAAALLVHLSWEAATTKLRHSNSR
eukprot:6179945-Pleurochrysis_carterae.AAC.4